MASTTMARRGLRPARKVEYPTSDGKPMAETDWHRQVMTRTIQILQRWFGTKPLAYVSGNLLIFYVPGNKRRHVSPDVFVVFGVEKKNRLYFLTWEEGKFPSVVIEITSKSTRHEDMHKKFTLYRDVFKVKEYIQFDPFGDYLKPQLQGYRLVKGEYVRIPLADGRLWSKQLGLFLEANGTQLELIDPATERRLLAADEELALAEQKLQDKEAEIAALRRALEQKRNGKLT